MRALWDAYGAWTYMVIVSFVGNLPNLSAEEQVVLQNQLAIGNAVKPYYLSAAGNKLNEAAQGPHPLRGKGPRRRQSGQKTKLAQAEAAWFVTAAGLPTSSTPPTRASRRPALPAG